MWTLLIAGWLRESSTCHESSTSPSTLNITCSLVYPSAPRHVWMPPSPRLDSILLAGPLGFCPLVGSSAVPDEVNKALKRWLGRREGLLLLLHGGMHIIQSRRTLLLVRRDSQVGSRSRGRSRFAQEELVLLLIIKRGSRGVVQREPMLVQRDVEPW
jgi:hypothetical protein